MPVLRLAALVVIALAIGGCYRSHERSGAGPAADACSFSVHTGEPGEVRCAVPTESAQACTEVALCLCAAEGARTDAELRECTGAALTLRALITLADFCDRTPTLTVADAVEQYLDSTGAGGLEVDPACEDVPALVGPTPYAECRALDEVLCPCAPGPCEVDTLFGRPCLAMPRAQVLCVRDGLPHSDVCAADLPALLRACGA